MVTTATTPPGMTPVYRPAPSVSPSGPGSALALRASLVREVKASRVDAAVRRVATDLERRAKELEDHAGAGFEHFGSGDPDVVRRRALVSQLLNLPAAMQPDALDEPWAKGDAEIISRVDRLEAPRSIETITEEAIATLRHHGSESGAKNLERRRDSAWKPKLKDVAQAVWSFKAKDGANEEALKAYYFQLILEERMERNAKVNDERAISAATALTSGDDRFFEVDHARFSTQVLGRIDDAKLRARTLLDILLQFREPINRNTETPKDTAGGAGVQSVLEMRQYLGKLDCEDDSPAARGEYALARAVVLANPVASSNSILEARHLVGKIRRMSWELVYGDDATQAGFKTNPYEAIHHNFSVDTPKLIAAFTGETVFGGGDPRTFCKLTDALGQLTKADRKGQESLAAALAADPTIDSAYRAFASTRDEEPTAARLEAFLMSRCTGKLDSRTPSDGTLTGDERRHLERGDVTAVKGEYATKLALVARLYRTVCEALPSADTLSDHLFSARGAVPAVAEAMLHLRSDDATRVETLSAITRARAALKTELSAQPMGCDRIEILRLDKQLESLTASQLGGVVSSIGDVSNAEQRVEALASLGAALDGAVLSGLDAIAGDAGADLSKIAGEIAEHFGSGKIELSEYRALVARAYDAIVRATDGIKSAVDMRVPEVSEGKLVPNPGFVDDFIKEGPLHYARAIAQKAIRVGASSEVSAARIVNPTNVTVLNPLGRAVFDRVLIAPSMSALKSLNPGRGDMCWVTHMDDKKMIAVGGIMSDFPGGYCHAAVYARGAGIAALSNPEITQPWSEFVDALASDKLYYDDTGGQITMMPLSDALAAGVVADDEADRLRPGSNREINYLDWSEADDAYGRIARHDIKVHESRPTDVIELYGTSSAIRGKGDKALTFAEMGRMGTAARALVGEKSLVLGLMSADPKLRKLVPPGSAITTLRVQKLLDDAGVLRPWLDLWERDPVVGKITDENFLESRFYTDLEYRTSARNEMSALVKDKLTAQLLDSSGEPTEAGAALLAELATNEALAACDNWIVRSSFTAEDRPGKSGAGQYDSFPNCRTDAERLRGVVGVVASAWEYAPIENNVAEEYNLAHIWPAITVMKCVNPEKSGVMISRDTSNGHRRTVSYQAVKGFGGGVDSGRTQEGRVTEAGENQRITRVDEDALVSDELAPELWSAAMAAEHLFHRVVEPGKGHAVDIEWVVEAGELSLVQARTVRV